jgi:hypothetical protein
MTVASPRGDAEIAGLEDGLKRLFQAVSMSSDLAIGDVELNDLGESPPQPAKRDVRFKKAHAGEVEPRRRVRRRVRSLTISDRDDRDRNAPRQSALNQTSRAENLVVGVRRDHDHSLRGRPRQRFEVVVTAGGLPKAFGLT